MNRKKSWMALGLLLLAFAMPALAFECVSVGAAGKRAEGVEGRHHLVGHGPGGRFYALASRLDLTQEQIDRLYDLQSRQISETAPIRNELLQKRLEMRKMFTDPANDEASILAKQREIEVIQQKLREKVTQFRLEQRRVLTPDQLKQLNEMASQR